MAAPPRLPRLAILAGLALGLLVLLVLVTGYVSAQRHIAGLEAELRGLYAREADLQSTIERQEQRIKALTTERDTLRHRLAAQRRKAPPLRKAPPPRTRRR